MNKFVSIVTALTLVLTALPSGAVAQPKGCPPGLAKKSPACVPPGQAKKGVTAREWSRGDTITGDWYDRLERGDRIIFDGEEYVVVERDGRLILRRDDDFYRLPRLDRNRDYVRIGDQILTVNRETRQVIEVIRLIDLLLS